MSSAFFGFVLLFSVIGSFKVCCFGISKNKQTCSWEKCTAWKEGMLNVHLVPHSHDDAGWLKTIDQYFWGGQLEFIGGGWVQNDEATTHYAAIIHQMSHGLRILNETFGRCGHPKVAWQIDPFGHSREQAAIFAQMGMDAVFFSRLHYIDEKIRQTEKNMEFIWKGSDDLGDKADILTGVLFKGYGAPPGFCFDDRCADDPIMDDDRFEGYNLPQKLASFLNYTNLQSRSYKTRHIMLTMGGDYAYRNADMWFNNMDKLIYYINDQSLSKNVNVFYSTPSCYVRALHESHEKWQTKTDDFFPYGSGAHSYWTGFFTSRPTLKGFVRQSNALLQMAKQLDATARLGPADFRDLEVPSNEQFRVSEQAFAFLQHHDGVSGTEKQHVANDYAKRLYRGNVECQQVVNDAFGKLLPLKADRPPLQSFCFYLNETICNVSQNSNTFVVSLFNPQAHPVSTYVRVPVAKSYLVTNATGNPVQVQVVKSFIPGSLDFKLNGASAPFELIFPVSLPPMGFSSYYCSAVSDSRRTKRYKKIYVVDVDTKAESSFYRAVKNVLRHAKRSQKTVDRGQQQPTTLKNQHVELTFDGRTGLLSQMKDVQSGHVVNVKQNFLWYKGATFGNHTGKQASGAYIFRPNGTDAQPVTVANVKMEKISGPWSEEIRQTFTPWVSQSVRLYKGMPYAELEWTVGPIPYLDKTGKEVVSRFDTDIQSNKEFFTDSNGRQILKRIRNYQPTYTYNNTEPVSGNYYPVNTKIFIKDSSMQFTVLTDRSQGGSSLRDGSLELMVHRRLFEDDGFGVGEALNETGNGGRGLVVRGKHWLVLSSVDKAAALQRQLALDMFYQPIMSFASTNLSPVAYKQKFRTQFSGIQQSLPPNVHILTLEQWHASRLLIRVEHIFQNHEDTQLSKPVTFTLHNLFTTFEIVSVEEMNLAANEALNHTRRLRWSQDDQLGVFRFETEDHLQFRQQHEASRDLNRWETRRRLLAEPDPLEITLKPMEIRTFRCATRPKTWTLTDSYKL